MNGTEQKNHRRVTDDLAKALAELDTSTAAVVDRLRDNITAERTHRLKLADDQRAYVDARDRELRECCQERWDETAVSLKRGFDNFSALRNRSFWSRLNWLLTGR